VDTGAGSLAAAVADFAGLRAGVAIIAPVKRLDRRLAVKDNDWNNSRICNRSKRNLLAMREDNPIGEIQSYCSGWLVSRKFPPFS